MKPDLLLGGNFDGLPPELGGRMSASFGLVLRGDGTGHFTPMPASESGFFVPGQTRDIQHVGGGGRDLYVVARNNDKPLIFMASKRRAAPRAVATTRRRAASAAPTASSSR